MKKTILLNLVVLLVIVASAPAATCLVPSEYLTIQSAIDDCNDGDIVEVQPGTYTGVGNYDIDFKGKAITVRSTDPNDPAVVASTIVDCQSAGRGFHFQNGEEGDSVLAGLTITKGLADGGGGIFCSSSSPTIRDCTISQCTASWGGGVCSGYGSPAVIHCVLTGNHAIYEGGALSFYGGSPLISNCVITGNSAATGGGIDAVSSALTIANCMITDNCADGGIPGLGSGGGIYSIRGNPIITNCTIANNSAIYTGGGITCYQNKPTIANSIIWGNTALSTTNVYGQPLVSYSNIQGGFSGTGNIDADPLFVDLGSGNFHLSAASPCIDAGNPAYSAPPGQTDIDGDPRLLGLRVDMGADEMLNDALAIAVFPNLVHFNILEGQTNLPEKTIQIWNPGIGTLNWCIAEDCPWLQVNPQAGTSTNELDQVILTVDPTSLHWGHYDCQLTVSDPCAINSPRMVHVLLDVIGPDIKVSAAHIQFSAYEGDAVLPQQTFTIRNDGGGLLSWQAGADCDWLDVSPTAGTSRGDANEITLTADVSDLPWGHYDCNVTISDPNAANSPVTLPVSLELGGPVLSVDSSRFNFLTGKENPTPSDQPLSIQNIGGGTLNWQITAPNDCNWFSVYPLTGRSTGQVNEVTLSVDAAGLEYGSYSCQLLISDPNAQHGLEAIQVNLTLRAPVIAAEPTSFQFHAWQTDPGLFEQTLSIHNDGNDTLNWLITVPDDWDWLSVYPLSGRSRGDVNEVTLTVDTTALAGGFYNCDLTISDPNASNSPQTIEVRLHLGLEQGRLYVPGEYPNIQTAIDWALSGDVVVIAPGTYTGPGNRDISFLGKPITVRSETGPENCIIDCNGTKAEPHRGFYFHSGEDANSILNGFTIVNGYSDKGGGICCQESSPTITNCTITCNSAERLVRAGGDGGGIACWYGSRPTVTNCTFSGNSAGGYGGGIACWYGSRPTVTNCTFNGNSASHAGGIYSYVSDAVITNCTFTGNSSGHAGAIAGLDSSSTVINCIFWNNIPSPIYAGNSLPTVAYCNVQGGWPGEGNINADPHFAQPGYWDTNATPEDANDDFRVDGDYRLKSQGWRWDTQRKMWTWDDVTSPCIDAGNPGSPLRDELLSVPSDPNNEWGQNLRINMGAYGGTAEASMPPYDWALLADLTNDGIVDFADLANWSEYRLRSGNDRPGDLDRNAIVNITDFAWLAQDWHAETSWFSLPPGQASNPTPADGSTDVFWELDLSWMAGSYATSHDVSFGTSSPGTFRGNQTTTTFDPGWLAGDTQYFWRIDEVNRNGTTTGTVWSFTTAPGKVRGCFTADTGVWVEGALVQISKVPPGQKVGKLASIGPAAFLREIESIEEHQGTFDECYDIVLESGNRISVVDCHYFLVDSGRWVAVQNLRSGSKLMSLNGPITVSRIVKRAVPFVGKCYNLKIKGSERYFIGKDAVIVRDW